MMTLFLRYLSTGVLFEITSKDMDKIIITTTQQRKTNRVIEWGVLNIQYPMTPFQNGRRDLMKKRDIPSVVNDVRSHRRHAVLTHWPLGDVAAILNYSFSNAYQWQIFWAFSGKLLSNECRRSPLMISQHRFRYLVPSGNMPLPEPMLSVIMSPYGVIMPQWVKYQSYSLVVLTTILWTHEALCRVSDFPCGVFLGHGNSVFHQVSTFMFSVLAAGNQW